jgi:peptidoglycan/LPS O-acetylase OafA/YrhL
MAEQGLRHYRSLDGLRGLAILLVVPHNTDITVPVLHGPFAIFAVLIDRGWVGVQLFFVLSGFLITEQLCRTRHAPNYLGGFYARRVLRIVPLYIAAVLLAWVLMGVLASRGHAVAHTPAWALWLGILVINWTEPLGTEIPGFPQFWSLALEEQFYLVWPFVVRAFAPRLFAVTVAIAGAALGLRVLMLLLGANTSMVYMWTISRMDALAFGAMAALIVQGWRVRGAAAAPLPWVVGGVVIAVVGAFLTELYEAGTWATQTVGFTCLGLACMCVLLGAVANDLAPRQRRSLSVLRSGLLASVGRYSYGMYVFHMFFAIFAAAWVKRIADSFGDARMIACALLMLALSYVLGFLSYHLYEKHFLRLGRRYFAAPESVPTNSGVLPP